MEGDSKLNILSDEEKKEKRRNGSCNDVFRHNFRYLIIVLTPIILLPIPIVFQDSVSIVCSVNFTAKSSVVPMS